MALPSQREREGGGDGGVPPVVERRPRGFLRVAFALDVAVGSHPRSARQHAGAFGVVALLQRDVQHAETGVVGAVRVDSGGDVAEDSDGPPGFARAGVDGEGLDEGEGLHEERRHPVASGGGEGRGGGLGHAGVLVDEDGTVGVLVVGHLPAFLGEERRGDGGALGEDEEGGVAGGHHRGGVLGALDGLQAVVAVAADGLDEGEEGDDSAGGDQREGPGSAALAGRGAAGGDVEEGVGGVGADLGVGGGERRHALLERRPEGVDGGIPGGIPGGGRGRGGVVRAHRSRRSGTARARDSVDHAERRSGWESDDVPARQRLQRARDEFPAAAAPRHRNDERGERLIGGTVRGSATCLSIGRDDRIF